MPCYKPLRAAIVDGPEGKRLLFKKTANAPFNGKGISLPCGRCIGCRLERARQWAVRLMHEEQLHSESSFITLTYNEKNLPKNKSINVSVCQKFLKKLRAQLAPKKIRFFLAGEYGELCANCNQNKFNCWKKGCRNWKTSIGRPHYHALIFGWVPPDPILYKSEGGHNLYTSRILDRIWGNGDCSFGAVSFDSACYVASYAVKKITGKKAEQHYKGRRPEFVLMSRGGRNQNGKNLKGIGHGWLEKFGSDVYPNDEVIVNGVPTRPPRYYDTVMEKKTPT